MDRSNIMLLKEKKKKNAHIQIPEKLEPKIIVLRGC